MAMIYDEQDLAEMEKKKKALKSATDKIMPKAVENLQHSAKAVDMMDMGEEKVDRSGKPCPTCGKSY